VGPLRRRVALTGAGQTTTETPGARGFIDVRPDISGAGNWAALFVFASAAGRLLQPGLHHNDRELRFATKKRVNALKPGGFASDVAPTHRGGRAGARANRPYTLRWERPDAERQPNLSALRSSLGNIATVSRGASREGSVAPPV
jgi:hypothetical protein